MPRSFQTNAPRRVAGPRKGNLSGAPVFGFFEAWGFDYHPAARGVFAAKALRSRLLCRSGSRSSGFRRWSR
jgi:hypothetical protein